MIVSSYHGGLVGLHPIVKDGQAGELLDEKKHADLVPVGEDQQSRAHSAFYIMRNEGWIHSIADEPQAGIGSVPAVLETSGTEAVMIGMHGRNTEGWHSSGQPNWREVRYLYRYSTEELDWQP